MSWSRSLSRWSHRSCLIERGSHLLVQRPLHRCLSHRILGWGSCLIHHQMMRLRQRRSHHHLIQLGRGSLLLARLILSLMIHHHRRSHRSQLMRILGQGSLPLVQMILSLKIHHHHRSHQSRQMRILGRGSLPLVRLILSRMIHHRSHRSHQQIMILGRGSLPLVQMILSADEDFTYATKAIHLGCDPDVDRLCQRRKTVLSRISTCIHHEMRLRKRKYLTLEWKILHSFTFLLNYF